MNFKNQPYKKQYNSNGELLNPIRIGRPFINEFPARSIIRSFGKKKLLNNLQKVTILERIYINTVKEDKSIMNMNSTYGTFRRALYKSGSAKKEQEMTR